MIFDLPFGLEVLVRPIDGKDVKRFRSAVTGKCFFEEHYVGGA